MRGSNSATSDDSLTLMAIVGAVGCDKMLAGASGSVDASVITGGALARESRAMCFPIGSGSSHATETCDGCQGGFNDFKRLTCQSCHRHQADVAAMRRTFTADFQNQFSGCHWTESACHSCHPKDQ